MLIFIILLVIFFLIKTVISNQNDKQTLKETSIQDKFRIIINKVNSEAFAGRGSITKIDWQSFMLGQIESNQIITFIYSHRNLSIEWKYKYFQKEMNFNRSFSNVDNLSLFGQEKIAQNLITEFNRAIENHKNEVNNISNVKPLKGDIEKNNTNNLPVTKTIKFNSLFVGKIRFFKLDEDQFLDNICVIDVIAGKAPSKLMMSKEEAINNKFQLDHSYLIVSNETTSKTSKERTFKFEAVKELTETELLSAEDKLGSRVIVKVD
jgi:hypothetical protein